jgi:hypothetical protein
MDNTVPVATFHVKERYPVPEIEPVLPKRSAKEIAYTIAPLNHLPNPPTV